mgnify:CR=1 FL=1
MVADAHPPRARQPDRPGRPHAPNTGRPVWLCRWRHPIPLRIRYTRVAALPQPPGAPLRQRRSFSPAACPDRAAPGLGVFLLKPETDPSSLDFADRGAPSRRHAGEPLVARESLPAPRRRRSPSSEGCSRRSRTPGHDQSGDLHLPVRRDRTRFGRAIAERARGRGPLPEFIIARRREASCHVEDARIGE